MSDHTDKEDDSSIEITLTPVKKQDNRGKNYVLTEKRKEQFAKAREIRQQNIEKRKLEKLELQKQHEEKKKAIEDVKVKRVTKKQEKELKDIAYEKNH